MTNRIVNNLIGSIDGLYKNRNAGHTHYSGIYRNGKPYYLGSNIIFKIYLLWGILSLIIKIKVGRFE
jgi:hypothetical protein